MKPPAIRRSHYLLPARREEHGITMVLVAIAMVAIIAMAALSIDVVTLYLAKEEAQRAADAAALAAARMISLSGITGDPRNSTGYWGAICGGLGSPASQAASAVATQSTVGSIAPSVLNVNYSAGGSAPTPDCSKLTFTSGVNNPLVTVQLTRASLPTFFSRIWGNTGNSVSATATAEVFNPSDSGNVGNVVTGTITPVQPRCVKPWIVPNKNPLNPSVGGFCDQTGGPCNTLVGTADGSITNGGISLGGTSANGVIGETFWLEPDCTAAGGTCGLRNTPPVANYYSAASKGAQRFLKPPPSVEYLPGETRGVAPVSVPSCSSGRPYEEAIAGCDQSTVYQCGVQSSNQVDLNENPGLGTKDTMSGVKCLIHETDQTILAPSGQDALDVTAFPFQIFPGTNNPLAKAGLAGTTPITSSPSIVSLPIYDSTNTIGGTGTSPVTIVGFLQVFINWVDQYGNVKVTVLNVAGCSNGSGQPVGTAVAGSSPVPVRLITPP